MELERKHLCIRCNRYEPLVNAHVCVWCASYLRTEIFERQKQLQLLHIITGLADNKPDRFNDDELSRAAEYAPDIPAWALKLVLAEISRRNETIGGAA